MWSPMGPKNLAVLTGDHINEGFFTRKCMAILPCSLKKIGDLIGGRKVGFHCNGM